MSDHHRAEYRPVWLAECERLEALARECPDRAARSPVERVTP